MFHDPHHGRIDISRYLKKYTSFPVGFNYSKYLAVLDFLK